MRKSEFSAMSNRPIGAFLTLRDFCTCTKTYSRFQESIDPWPLAPESLDALRGLATHLLDPIIAHFGATRFHLTYGFCSDSLRRHLVRKDPATGKPYGRVAPALDQHMAHETNAKGGPFGKRQGAASDFRIEGVSAREVLRWVIQTRLPFDRVYYYGEDRSLHVSWGPDHSRYLCGFNSKNVPSAEPVRDLVHLVREVYLP